jgi:general secretion pathway protein A
MPHPIDRFVRPDAGSGTGTLAAVSPDGRTAGLTYEPFYGLREKPFSLAADPRFFYQSRAHAPAFDELLHAVRRREALNVLTGPVGAGKTTLCRALLESLDRKTFSAFVPDPFASREDLLKIILADFGVTSPEELTGERLRGASRTELSYLLQDFLASLAPLQAFAVVFLDEAQNLSLPLLEELRILSDGGGPLQLVLVGQPELEDKLQLPDMCQLEQRVSVHCRLAPLDCAGVAGYISHRLHRAGGSADRIQFGGDAVESIFEQSGGVPRIINRLCDRALQAAHSRRASTIDREILEASKPRTRRAAARPGLQAIAAFPPEREDLAYEFAPIDAAAAPTDAASAVPAAAEHASAQPTALAQPAGEAQAACGATEQDASDPLDAWLAGVDDRVRPGKFPIDFGPDVDDAQEEAPAAVSYAERRPGALVRIRIGSPRRRHRHRHRRVERRTDKWTRRVAMALLMLAIALAATAVAPSAIDMSSDLWHHAAELVTPPPDAVLPPDAPVETLLHP